MGFWHTGYMEFHEPDGLDEYKPINRLYRCPECSLEFITETELREHRFAIHPAQRPILMIGGRDATTAPMRFVKRFRAAEVAVAHTSSCEINGQKLELSAFPKMLAGLPPLSTNRVLLKSEKISAEFRIVMDVATTKDLDGVDQQLQHLAKGHELSTRRVEEFIDACSGYNSAASYVEGICDYLYGVLSRERFTDSSLPYETYIKKFNRAANLLHDYPRPLAAVICGLIAFHFNQFSEVAEFVPESRVASAAFSMFGKNDTNSKIDSGETNFLNIEKMLTDHDTESIMTALFDSSNATAHEHLRNLLHGYAASFDIPKIRSILARQALSGGDVAAARRYAGEVRNNRPFEAWAERFLSQIDHVSDSVS